MDINKSILDFNLFIDKSAFLAKQGKEKRFD